MTSGTRSDNIRSARRLSLRQKMQENLQRELNEDSRLKNNNTDSKVSFQVKLQASKSNDMDEPQNTLRVSSYRDASRKMRAASPQGYLANFNLENKKF